MSGLLLNLATGLGVLAGIAAGLFLFGCAMCALTDHPADANPAPLWVRLIGWAAIIIPLATLIGWTVRAST